MKKLASILLLTILLFNWVGYRLMTSILQQQADTELQSSVEQNRYNDDDLVEIRVPLNLPYQTDWKEFQSYDGNINVDGVEYRYVKRKVEKGELVLLCIPNHSKAHLATARDRFFMLVNDLQHNGHSKSEGKQAHIVKSPVTEYFHEQNSPYVKAYIESNPIKFIEKQNHLLHGFDHALIKPPGLVS
ncbi:MAG TPA: hypothetical protein VLC28_09885 [Flavitalea sp.]|nr:hypothetical protein [Flavitalea sp.]